MKNTALFMHSFSTMNTDYHQLMVWEGTFSHSSQL